MTTSNTYNRGIMHAVYKFGQKPLCGTRRAIMATEVKQFKGNETQCKRCAAKLADAETRSEKKKVVGTIDLTPTWSALVPLYIAALVDGSPTAQSAARGELTRMAKLADAYVALSKAA